MTLKKPAKTARRTPQRILRKEIVAIAPALRRFAYALTASPADADDLTQETIVRLLRKGAPQGANIKAWALRVCRNLWIDQLRALRVRARTHCDDILDAPAIDGERAAFDRLAVAETQAAMGVLTPEQRSVLNLIVFEGLTYADAARTIGAPIGTVMSRLCRARKALAECRGGEAAQAA